MDNSYDKRISNLEAVVTPLIADRVNQQQVQEMIQSEIQNTLISSLAQIIDERLSLPLAEKDRQISSL